MRRRISVTGSTLRARPTEEKNRIIRAFLYRFGADLTGGRIKPVVDRVVPVQEVADAHRRMAAGEIFGKLILKVG